MAARTLEGIRAREGELPGREVEVGFRPSGELHVGNLVSVAAAAVVASEEGWPLRVTCCDTDWDSNTHLHRAKENSDVMKLFFEREDPGSCHDNIADHRLEQARPYIDALVDESGTEGRVEQMTDIQRQGAFREALVRLMEQMDAFDEIWGGGFRRMWMSPVAPVCQCGFSPAKGAAYAEESDSFVFPCWHEACDSGFHEAGLEAENRLGVHFLVDPVRDTSSADTGIHVFGGDYATTSHEEKTTKLTKVRRVTDLANGETPAYMVAPMVVDPDGKPLSKSKGTGRTLSELPPPDELAPGLVDAVEGALKEGREHLREDVLAES